jgi:hypothetical protein
MPDARAMEIAALCRLRFSITCLPDALWFSCPLLEIGRVFQ